MKTVRDVIFDNMKRYKGINTTIYDAVKYKETSKRFLNGKQILCPVDKFLTEFGDYEVKVNAGGSEFKVGDKFFEIITVVNFENEKSWVLNNSPIIIEDNSVIKMQESTEEFQLIN